MLLLFQTLDSPISLPLIVVFAQVRVKGPACVMQLHCLADFPYTPIFAFTLRIFPE